MNYWIQLGEMDKNSLFNYFHLIIEYFGYET
jgi:hypothetical protein